MHNLRFFFFKFRTPFLKKGPSEIHSQTITETDRQKTLQPFALAGNAQVPIECVLLVSQ